MTGRKREKEGIETEKKNKEGEIERRYTTNVYSSVNIRHIQFWAVTGIISIGYVLCNIFYLHVSAFV
jgi:hypothetical protein